MKKQIIFFLFLVGSMISCRQEISVAPDASQDVPKEIIAKLSAAGFATSRGLSRFENGYLVEFDIFMTEKEINSLEVADKANGRTDHYHTNNLVNPGPITIWIDPAFDASVVTAFEEALFRYSQVHMQLNFVEVEDATEADIDIQVYPGVNNGLLAISAFPSGGNPGTPIKLNTYYFSDAAARADAVSVIAHEIGHAIGLRHTDYADVSSCLTGQFEGDDGSGAVHIPGTPTGTSSGSFMLACTDGNDRPFTNDDKTALMNLYQNDSGRTITIVNNIDPNSWNAVIEYSLGDDSGWTPVTGSTVTFAYPDYNPIWRVRISNTCSNNSSGDFGYRVNSSSPVTSYSSYQIGSGELTMPGGTASGSSNYTLTFNGQVHVGQTVNLVNNLSSTFYAVTKISYSYDNGTTWCDFVGTSKTFTSTSSLKYRVEVKNVWSNSISLNLYVQAPLQSAVTPCNINTGCNLAPNATIYLYSSNGMSHSGSLTVHSEGI